MTNEEAKKAKKELKALLNMCNPSPLAKELEDALKMAIKAIDQQPILEKDGTLIVTTEHYENVGRVLVQHGTSGTLFYQDHEPCEEREQVKCPFYAS